MDNRPEDTDNYSDDDVGSKRPTEAEIEAAKRRMAEEYERLMEELAAEAKDLPGTSVGSDGDSNTRRKAPQRTLSSSYAIINPDMGRSNPLRRSADSINGRRTTITFSENSAFRPASTVLPKTRRSSAEEPMESKKDKDPKGKGPQA